MQDPRNYGLDRGSSQNGSLIVSPDEALRPDARCPCPQCRLTDDLLARSYNIAARMGRISNLFSHLILALSQSLQESGVDSFAQTLSDASLPAFAFMSRELGRFMSTVTLAGRQVWLVQSPLSEGCRRTLCLLPVVPGQMFGPAVHQALERSVLACNRSRFQLLGRRIFRHLFPATFIHLLAQVDNLEPLASLGTMSSTAGLLPGQIFRCQAHQPPVVALPKDLRGGGVRPEVQGVGVRRFSQQHLSD